MSLVSFLKEKHRLQPGGSSVFVCSDLGGRRSSAPEPSRPRQRLPACHGHAGVHGRPGAPTVQGWFHQEASRARQTEHGSGNQTELGKQVYSVLPFPSSENDSNDSAAVITPPVEDLHAALSYQPLVTAIKILKLQLYKGFPDLQKSTENLETILISLIG